MDDPWGSPWAATDTTDKDQKPYSPAKSDIAPPPRAFLSVSSSPRIPSVLEQSPWGGDDDGFGEWATASETPPAHSVWAGGWGGSNPNLAATPREDLLGTASPIAWPGSVATPKPNNGSAFRQPSPDPWASGFSSRRPSIEGVSTPRLVVEAASPVEAHGDTLGKDGLGIEVGAVWGGSDVVDSSEQIPTEKPEPDTAEPKEITETLAETESEKQPTSAPIPESDVRASVESVPQSRDYQSSTPSNENTDHEDERQDSPGTSIDDEPRRLRPTSRKASGKVHELVVKFDGLARAASEEREIIPRGRSKSPLGAGVRGGSDEPGDFGDFEEADESASPVPLEPSAVEPEAEPLGAPGSPAALSPPPVDNAPPVSSPIARFGPLNFSVDIDSISKLFTALPKPANSSITDSEVPDHIISDSFTEISERKTWYRISRLGSSRRHNAADDESYRRVAWPTSTVHDDTIRIVRRWMEEDSIAGRVALGGGISKTQKNMFGWDSSAEPVTLDAVFRKKSSHSRASSLQPLPTAGHPLKGVEGHANAPPQGPIHRPTGSTGPALASFGWGSNSPAPAEQALSMTLRREPPKMTMAAPRPEVSAGPTRTASKPPPLTKPTPPAPAPASQPIANNTDEDDDDEWGEMVSSPVVSQHPTNGPSVHQPLAAAFPPAPVPQAQAPLPQAKDDPWGAADFSVFESGSAKASPADTKPAEPSSTGPNAPPASTAVVVRSAIPTTAVGSSTFSSRTGQPRPAIAQDTHDEEAQRIIANLPDLSYMLR